jgi:hypothetical protein
MSPFLLPFSGRQQLRVSLRSPLLQRYAYSSPRLIPIEKKSVRENIHGIPEVVIEHIHGSLSWG